MKKYLFYLFLVALGVFHGCERDDICAESTPTTPNAIITFFDVVNPETLKSVTGLRIIGDGQLSPLSEVNVVTTDSIAIPLRTDMNQTIYIFHQDYEEDADGNITGGNPDTVTISYDTEEVYVSRACGFKTVFNNFQLEVEEDGDKWILSDVNADGILNIENENQAHINIRH